ncbi:GNAT family N-acetyltransferase [Sorangium sp. So ce854]|uniref:GNAT family N-acetyltransferase n=1 Tax=Sorangium sp. So ce854 TaxID=3133322 RepID=UPI003F60BCE1
MIRQASADDAAAIARIYNQNLDEQGFANCDLTPQTTEHRLKAMREGGERYPTFVSTSDDGRVLGWSSLKRWSTRPHVADVAEIAVYVDRSRRGNVVGAQLLCHLLGAARQRGFRSLVSIVLGRNVTSLRGVLAAGFAEVARLREAASLRGQWVDIVWLEKDLTVPDSAGLARHMARFAPQQDRSAEDFMMQTGETGSYEFGAFRDNDVELGRLKHQARVGLALERAIWAKLGIRPGMKVLDLASGPGVVSCELARAIDPGQVVGVDANPRFIEIARAVQQEEQVKNVEFRRGNAYELDVEAGSFDVVYARFLFQHLDQPGRALSEIFRVLRPGGMVCVGDIDDGWLMLHPEPARFSAFVAKAAAAQRAKGGDRAIGRKLYGLFKAAGFTDVRTSVLPVTSQDLGLKNLLEIITGFKRELIPASQIAEAEQDLADVYTTLSDPDAWGAVGVFYAVGKKP